MTEAPDQIPYDYVILGAGIAGLAFAYEMAEAGSHVLVLERERQIGGLGKTLNHNGFLLDYCAHRFHSNNPRVMDRAKDLMGSNFKKHKQKSRIFMFGRFLNYPFELFSLLRAMPTKDALISGFDFGINILTRNLLPKKKIKDYHSWFVYHFGERLYRVMCEPYTSKIWKGNPGLLSADWADQRFQGVNLKKLLKRIFLKLIRLDFSSYSVDDESLAPDGGEFYYPEKGIQQISDRYTECIESKNGKVLTQSDVFKIDADTKIISYHDDSGLTHNVRYSRALISTIPLHALYFALGKKDASVENDLRELKYMHIIFVYLFLNKKKVSDDHWLYFPDADIIFNRSVEFKSWSEKMAPPDQTALCLDITCFENDDVWTASNEELAERCKKDAEKIGLAHSNDVFDYHIVRVRNAYPYYDLDYRRKLTNIVRHCEKSGVVYCLGRTGIFKYNNSDGSIEMAIELSDRLKAQTKDPIPGLLDYNLQYTSL